MIHSIKIQNFQSHKDTTINLNKGVNIIVGSSDSGKSAILRAFRWVVYNKPRGDFFRSWWGGDTRVDIELDTHIISKLKTNAETIYILFNKDTEETLEFRAFGNDVPEEIIRIINLSDINLQQQLDKPFLISESPGEVAQHFNRMAKLEKIDTGIRNINSKIRSIEQSLTFEKTRLQETKDKYQQYSYLDELEVKITEVENTDKQRIILQNKVNIIEDLANNHTTIKNKIIDITKITGAEPLLQELIKQSRVWLEQKQKSRLVTEILQDITESNHSIQIFSSYIKGEKKLNSIIEQMRLLYDKENIKDKLYNIIQQASNTVYYIDKKQKEVKENEKIYKENKPKICPTCQRPL